MLVAYFKILRKRNFFCLWFGQIVSQFGDRLTQMALIGLVYKLQHGVSPLGLFKMMSLAIIPVFLFSPVAGVYIDRWDKRRTMYVSDLIRALFIFLIPLLCFRFKSLGLAYVFIFLSFSMGRFFIPAKMAMIPSIVPKKDLLAANSLVSVTAMIAAVLGLGFGGMIVEKWGVKTTFYLDSLTFIVSGVFIYLISMKENTHFHAKDLLDMSKDALETVKNSVIFELKEGIQYIAKSPETKYAIKVKITLFAIIGALYTVFIAFIQEALSTITLELGWLAVGAGGGLFVGTILYGRFGKKLSVNKTISLSLLLSSAHLIFFTSVLRWHPWKMFAFISCVILGILCSPIEIAITTFIHKKTKNEFLGRIFSSIEVVLHLTLLISMGISSLLAELMTPFTIILTVGIVMFLFSLKNLLTDNGNLHDTRRRT
ncbi:MAG: MFS transporter [Candidatus Omnitrophica bacterium]|nr:MFS transporter [Candidatus Omnitrophota bacterium]